MEPTSHQAPFTGSPVHTSTPPQVGLCPAGRCLQLLTSKNTGTQRPSQLAPGQFRESGPATGAPPRTGHAGAFQPRLSLIYAVLTASPAGPDASPQTPELGRTTFPLLIVLGINQHGWRGPDIKQKKNRSPEGYKPIMISVLFSPLAKLYKYTPLKTRGS